MDIEKEFERLGLGRKQSSSTVIGAGEAIKTKVAAMTYKVVQSNDPQILINKVNQELVHGWLPQGGVSIAFYGSGSSGFILDTYKYVQALVKV